MASLLIVDDEPNMLYSLQKELQSESLSVATAETAELGLAALREQRPDAVLLDVRLPDKSGIELLSEIREIDHELPIIIMTAYTTTELAINATQRGAYEFLPKPVPLKQLREVVNKAVELRKLSQNSAELENEQNSVDPLSTMIGDSNAMQHVYKQIGRVAGQLVNVLIAGESGTGKELCARSIHRHGCGTEQPFIAVNASAIPEPLLESELFGHERGAFTGADAKRVGKFELADGGTLFLDEIGDMPLALQAKLLRAIQEGQFERVGGSKLIQSRVRFIAATNQDLADLISTGKFRADLYYRLNGYQISIPALRERVEDLPSLVRFFIDQFNSEMERHVRGVAPGVMQLLTAHPWFGNIRELQNAVRHAFVNTTGDLLTAESFPAIIAGDDPHAERPTNDLELMIRQTLARGGDELFRRTHDTVDRLLLPAVLANCSGNRKAASELLGISRTTLLARLRALGLADPSSG